MMERFLRRGTLLFLPIFLCLLGGCATNVTGSVSRLNAQNTEVLPGPDTRGANSYLKPRKGLWRLRGGVALDKPSTNHRPENQKKPSIIGDCDNCAEAVDEFIHSTEKVEVDYKSSSVPFYGVAEYVHKSRNGMLLAVSFGFDQFLYGSFGLGYNSDYFEWGAFAYNGFSLFDRFRSFTTLYCHTDGLTSQSTGKAANNAFVMNLGAGFFASAYFDRYSLSYSISGYVWSDDKLVDLPTIVTQRTSVGILLWKKRFELRLGALLVSENIDGHFFGGFGDFGIRL